MDLGNPTSQKYEIAKKKKYFWNVWKSNNLGKFRFGSSFYGYLHILLAFKDFQTAISVAVFFPNFPRDLSTLNWITDLHNFHSFGSNYLIQLTIATIQSKHSTDNVAKPSYHCKHGVSFINITRPIFTDLQLPLSLSRALLFGFNRNDLLSNACD